MKNIILDMRFLPDSDKILHLVGCFAMLSHSWHYRTVNTHVVAVCHWCATKALNRARNVQQCDKM